MELLNCTRKGIFLNLQRKSFWASWGKRERTVEVSKLLEMDKGSKYFSNQRLSHLITQFLGQNEEETRIKVIYLLSSSKWASPMSPAVVTLLSLLWGCLQLSRAPSSGSPWQQISKTMLEAVFSQCIFWRARLNNPVLYLSTAQHSVKEGDDSCPFMGLKYQL